MRVFIAGPYTHGDVAVNVRKAMAAGLEVLAAGHHPFVPHLAHFLHLQSPQDYSVWTDMDFAFLEVCEAMIRLPGKSPGADEETRRAKQLEIPVYLSVIEWKQSFGGER